jgi:hypothetical protein
MPFAARRFAIPGALGPRRAACVAVRHVRHSAEQAIALSLVKRAADLVLGVPGLVGWQRLEMGRLVPNIARVSGPRAHQSDR